MKYLFLLSVLISTVLSFNVHAFNQSDFYTQKQLQHHYKGKKPIQLCNDFEAGNETFLKFKTPSQYMIAALVLSSMFIGNINQASAEPIKSKGNLWQQKKTSCPVATSSYLPTGAMKTGLNGGLISTILPNQNKIATYFIHPGLVSKAVSLNQKAIQKACTERNLFRIQNGKKVCIADQEMAGHYEIDQEHVEGDMYSRHHSDLAWNYVENSYFSNDNTGMSAAKKILAENADKFMQNLMDLNSLFNYGDIGKSDFRSKGFSSITRNGFLGIGELAKWGDFIDKHYPHLKPSYLKIVEIADDPFKYIKETENIKYLYRKVSPEVTKKDLQYRLELALELIGYAEKTNDFEVLNTFLVQLKNYDKRDFQKAFKSMRKAIIKKIKTNPVEAAAYAHMRYVVIHPHADGNGRTARALMNIILMSEGLKPVAFLSNEEYGYVVDKAAQENNYRIFYNFLLKTIEAQKQRGQLLEDIIDALDSCEGNCQELLDEIIY